MAIGASGRIVIEVDPELKNELYDSLKKEGLHMKDWFLANAKEFLKNRSQLSLQFIKDNKEQEKERK